MNAHFPSAYFVPPPGAYAHASAGQQAGNSPLREENGISFLAIPLSHYALLEKISLGGNGSG